MPRAGVSLLASFALPTACPPRPPSSDSLRWEASERYTFKAVDPAEAALTVRLHDARLGVVRGENRVLGACVISPAEGLFQRALLLT